MRIVSRPPALEPMLEEAEAALIIGDPALRLDPRRLDGNVYDLGEEWTTWTGLPMVFAVWAGRQEVIDAAVIAAFSRNRAATGGIGWRRSSMRSRLGEGFPGISQALSGDPYRDGGGGD